MPSFTRDVKIFLLSPPVLVQKNWAPRLAHAEVPGSSLPSLAHTQRITECNSCNAKPYPQSQKLSLIRARGSVRLPSVHWNDSTSRYFGHCARATPRIPTTWAACLRSGAPSSSRAVAKRVFIEGPLLD